MIAIRICRMCGKQFDAITETNKSVYCDECRELADFVSDQQKMEDDFDEIEKKAKRNKDVPIVDTEILESIRHSLNTRNIKGDELYSTRIRQNEMPSHTKKVNGFTVIEGKEVDTTDWDDIMKVLNDL